MLSLLPSILITLSALNLPSSVNYFKPQSVADKVSSSFSFANVGGVDTAKFSYTFQYLTEEIYQTRLDNLQSFYIENLPQDINTTPSVGQPSNMLTLTIYNSVGSILGGQERYYNPYDLLTDYAVNVQRFTLSSTSLYRYRVELTIPRVNSSAWSEFSSSALSNVYFGDITLYAFTIFQSSYDDVYNNGYGQGVIDGREWAYANPPEGQMSGIFGVLANGFDSLAGLLSIPLFPGFTLGTLLFLPLVIGVGYGLIKLLMGSK